MTNKINYKQKKKRSKEEKKEACSTSDSQAVVTHRPGILSWLDVDFGVQMGTGAFNVVWPQTLVMLTKPVLIL